MYYDKESSYWNIVSNYFKKDEDCFEIFKSRAKEKGIEICAVLLTKVKDSCYAVRRGTFTERVPYFKIYVRGEELYDKLKSEHPNDGLVNNETEILLKDLWLSVCKEKNMELEQIYDPKMYVGVSRVEEMLYTYFARNYKLQILDIIKSIIGCAPRSLYASSLPGINIVFQEDIYERYKVAEKEKKLVEKIEALAFKTVKAITDGVEVDCVLQVKCWHPKMQGYNGYGLARED